ncbi:Low molecular weight phosphotyrosine protein phosphatase [Paramarasmius palmivorus]|uniref:Low molecular weight phosphotyrosine protein phosphatase n=1 Tax=Paramarasmius palmivorus TaxID=297713 RepID=A0AAW0E1E5_9AGAR
MGEAVLRDIAKKRGLDIEVDSCGTGAYHVGEDPDDRYDLLAYQYKDWLIQAHLQDRCDVQKSMIDNSVGALQSHGVPISHQARKISTSDFTKFTHILAADGSNLRDLERIKPRDATAEVKLWGSYLNNEPIGDPYYGGINGFEKVFQQCVAFSNAFLDEVVGKSSES